MDEAENGLLQQAQRGDHAAFEQLVRRTSRLVYAHLVLITRNAHHAEDLTQETFCAAWKNLAKVADASGLRGWLLTLARNQAIDANRADRRLKRLPADKRVGQADFPDTSPRPDEAAALSEEQEHLMRTLETLPDDYREPLMLRYLAGADHDTIRTQLGMTDGALRGALHRGMSLLRERMTRTRT